MRILFVAGSVILARFLFEEEVEEG